MSPSIDFLKNKIIFLANSQKNLENAAARFSMSISSVIFSTLSIHMPCGWSDKTIIWRRFERADRLDFRYCQFRLCNQIVHHLIATDAHHGSICSGQKILLNLLILKNMS